MDETTKCTVCGNSPCTCAPAPETPAVAPENTETTEAVETPAQ